MAHLTDQERVDRLTMAITNPNVVGSGFIEHPPQVPFGGRVLVQPATVQPDDVPEWFAGPTGLSRVPDAPFRSGNGGRGSGNPRLNQAPQYPRSGHSGPPRAAFVPSHTAPHQAQLLAPVHRPAAAPVRQQQQQQKQHLVTHGDFKTATLVSAAQVAAVVPLPRAAPAVPPPPSPPVHIAEDDLEDKKLSKSQKAKLRKKMREGKA